MDNVMKKNRRRDLFKLKEKRLAVILLICFTGVLVLACFIQLFPNSPFDIAVSKEIQRSRGIDFFWAMKAISWFGQPLGTCISVLSCSLIFFVTKHRTEALFILATFLADGGNLLLKTFVQRPRPTLDLVEKLQDATYYSFPSGHVVHYVVFFGLILVFMYFVKGIPHFLKKIINVVCVFFILTVSISRIYLGAHWATDVLAAYLVGFIFLSIILCFYFPYKEASHDKIDPI